MPEILGVRIAVTNYAETAEKCVDWARSGQSRTVIFANVHVVMEACDNPAFRSKLNAADMVNPDGMPLVWALKALGIRQASRVYGPDAMQVLLGKATESNLRVGFYGGSPATLAKLVDTVRETYPGVEIAFTMSPPFRPLTRDEDEEVVRQIKESGTQILFVGLGCPKQEHWLMEHQSRIPAVMLAVGAAFDFLANTKPQAPRWMMRNGLEWVFRLATEPRRLAGRYLKHNPRFVALFLHQWMRLGAVRTS
jgi:N-acetylglucosaminyldiphosphoundecaprenol N-acetyl-beta-D-mannosaminyltransferase